KTAATKTAATKTAATKPAATKTAARAAVKSRLPFTVEHPELQAVAAWRGWKRPGLRLGLTAASLVYTTDRWSTVKTASLEAEGSEGFLLADVPAGTNIEFAVRASLVAAEEQGGAPAGEIEFWLNNSGRNYSATTL
ncbi:MAG: hypothetical protein ACO3JL_13285, partial [Myxococcota bacterium]